MTREPPCLARAGLAEPDPVPSSSEVPGGAFSSLQPHNPPSGNSLAEEHPTHPPTVKMLSWAQVRVTARGGVHALFLWTQPMCAPESQSTWQTHCPAAERQSPLPPCSGWRALARQPPTNAFWEASTVGAPGSGGGSKDSTDSPGFKPRSCLLLHLVGGAGGHSQAPCGTASSSTKEPPLALERRARPSMPVPCSAQSPFNRYLTPLGQEPLLLGSGARNCFASSKSLYCSSGVIMRRQSSWSPGVRLGCKA